MLRFAPLALAQDSLVRLVRDDAFCGNHTMLLRHAHRIVQSFPVLCRGFNSLVARTREIPVPGSGVRATQCVGYDVTIDLAGLPHPHDCRWELHVSSAVHSADLGAAMSGPLGGTETDNTGVVVDLDRVARTVVVRAGTTAEITNAPLEALTSSSTRNAPPLWTLHVRLPPRLESLAIFSAENAPFRGSILLSGKIEANDMILVAPEASSVTASKIRAETCSVECGANTALRVSDMLEAGRASLAAGSLSIGKLLADTASLDAAGHVAVRALYVREAEVRSSGGDVSVDGAHGSLRIDAAGAGAAVRVGGVTGSAAVHAPRGSAHVHFDSIRGASNAIFAGGPCAATLSAPASVRVHAQGAGEVVVHAGLDGTFDEEEGGDDGAAAESLNPGASAPAPVRSVRGTLTARPDVTGRGGGLGPQPPGSTTDSSAAAAMVASRSRGGSGKIRVDGGTLVTGFYSPQREEGAPSPPPLFARLSVASSTGSARVDVVTWGDAVRQRAGLREGTLPPPPGPGPACTWCNAPDAEPDDGTEGLVGLYYCHDD